MMHEILEKYFPELPLSQKQKLCNLNALYKEWNKKINVISRRDIENLNIHHILHSLSIAKIINFVPGTKILDIGTGGGFPGVPLAILFPETQFVLLDSIGKKIRVVTKIAEALSLNNILPVCERAENHKGLYDFTVSRAVATFRDLVKYSKGKIKKECINSLRNGIITLKGGTLSDELNNFLGETTIFPINLYFNEPYFNSKFIVYLPFY
ncbi:MAG: 16S rRNA (guanine(527)-N(7))-methyltransferase RsmG [Bacteroidales bacterium]